MCPHRACAAQTAAEGYVWVRGPVALWQLWSVLKSVAPGTTEDNKDRAAQSWLCPSLAENWPVPHQL